MKCPRCGSEMVKVIYMGLPGRLCYSEDEKCNCMIGPASWAARLYFNGHMLVFDGSYWRALWHWVWGP
jgi:hypothetical protein